MHKRRHSRGQSGLHAIVLAAGASRRYGSPKQLLRYRGEFLVARGVRLARLAGADAVCVVLGYRADPIRRALLQGCASPDETIVVTNPRWRDGMGRSLACGIRALPEKARAVLVCVGDQPLMQVEDLARLVAAWRGSPHTVVAARYAGKLGVPAVFPRRWFSGLRRLRGDRGAQALLASARGVIGVPMARAAFDLDRPKDFAELTRRESQPPPMSRVQLPREWQQNPEL